MPFQSRYSVVSPAFCYTTSTVSTSSAPTPSSPRRVVFLHTTAGGGHTSAAKAIIEALHAKYGDGVSCEMIDVLKDYAPKPLDMAPEAYNQMMKAPQLYRQVYELGDGHRRSRLITRSITMYTRRQADRMLDNHRADVIVSTYHFGNAPTLDALERRGNPIPFINVITDMVTIPPVWFDARADLTIVPTEPAFHQAVIAGMPQAGLRRIGLPVSPQFMPGTDKRALRQKLGWPIDRPVVLLMAGGTGVGPLASVGEAIATAGLPIRLVIVTGKNKRLAARITQEPWAKDLLVYSFVNNMPEFMQAADILVTKAGPGSITESLNVNLPMILFSRVPGQEEGNAEYVTHSGAGYWAPKKKELVATLRYLLSDKTALKRAQLAAKRLSNPKAATMIADVIMKTANKPRPKR